MGSNPDGRGDEEQQQQQQEDGQQEGHDSQLEGDEGNDNTALKEGR